MSDTTAEALSIDISGSAAVVTLNRPRALNALTTAMRHRFSEGLWAAARDPQVYAVIIQSACDRAFSAGSDVREVTLWGREDRPRARASFRDEYAMNWQCECFSKPTLPLIDGMVMGGGNGITIFGTHRIAGERYRFAMPETLIGLFPDVGLAHLFARLPGHVGEYLGLTGKMIGRADAYALGFVTHCIPARRFDEIKAEVADTWPVDTVLDSRHEDPGACELEPFRATIAECFAAPSVEDILARLDAVTGQPKVFAQETAAEIRRRSPLSLKVTLRHIREARGQDLRQALQVDYRLAYRCLEGRDFYEGVRAIVLDKDGQPKWRPDRLEDVTEAMLDDVFGNLGAEELNLPTREEMQSLRA